MRARSMVLALLCSLVLSCQREGGAHDAAPSPPDAPSIDSSAPLDVAWDDAAREDAPVGPPPDIHVRITGDNAYGFGFGPPSGLSSYFDGFIAGSAGDIFNCSQSCAMGETCMVGACDAFGSCNQDGRGAETFVVPGSAASAEDYLYIVAWSDDAITQGVLGQFVADGSGRDYFTGQGAWEVCATGMDFDSMSPDRALVEAQIVACNAGMGASRGWVDRTGRDRHALAFGETNAPGGDFPMVCGPPMGDGIGGEARWMWYDHDTLDLEDAFHSSGRDGTGEFLIFRLQIMELLI